MKNYRLLLAAALLLAACSPKAGVDLTVAGAPDFQIEVKLLDVNVYKVLDTVRTDASGRVQYSLAVKPGQPEFIYLFHGDTRIASLLLSEGENVVVKADTLGNYEVSGSEESRLLADVESRMASFSRDMNSTDDGREMVSRYLAYYRECVRYVMSNPKSLTVVPVLYQQLDANTPVFSQKTDAIIFRQAVDSLKTVYPESRYVKALDKEARRREDIMKMQTMIDSASVQGYPDLLLPDINGKKTALSELDAPAVLLHFWDSASAEDKMFNLDKLLPLWNRWHSRGLQIYAVDMNPDKSEWASVMKAQNLPWINVNDGRGPASPVVGLYHIQSLPVSFLLAGGELSATVNSEKELEKELSRILK